MLAPFLRACNAFQDIGAGKINFNPVDLCNSTIALALHAHGFLKTIKCASEWMRQNFRGSTLNLLFRWCFPFPSVPNLIPRPQP